MAIYDGFIEIEEGDVHVILGVSADRVTMSSNGAEIGAWPARDVSVNRVGNGVYTITAENESLRFVPNDPSLFALGFDEETESSIPIPGPRQVEEPRTPDITDAPPPLPLTRVLFYSLAGVTGVLGLWALVSMLVG